MSPVLRQVYDQMVEPKWVISMGVCASSGGMFNNYAIVQGVDQIVPVDVYVPGCPPGPETLMHGILTLHEQIRTRRAPPPPGHVAQPVAPRSSSPSPSPPRRDPEGPGPRRWPTTTPPLVKTCTSPTNRRPCPTTRSRPRSVSHFDGAVFTRSHGQPVVYVDRSVFADVARFLRDERAVHDVRRHTATDHLLDGERHVPDGVTAERYEVVVNFLSHCATAASA